MKFYYEPKRERIITCLKKANPLTHWLVSLLFMLALNAFTMNAFAADSSGAQNGKKITGVVKDSDSGETLIGVNVVEEGTTNGTITDANGEFALTVKDEKSVILVSYIGFNTERITVGSETSFEVIMKADLAALNEVVVIGYGTSKKGSVTGSVASVNSEDLEKVPAVTTANLLAGKMPGISFRATDGRPGASANIQVRNMGEPLFVIDGIIKDAGQFNNLSPNDIENISVLKDAAAAIYGARAANGVIIVTTKKGRKNEKPTINFEGYYGWSSFTRFPKGVDAYEWLSGRVESEVNTKGKTNIDPELVEQYRTGALPSFDWYDFIVDENVPQYSVNMNASGGSERTSYYFSVSHINQDAVFKDRNFNRSNIQSNVTTELANNFKVGVNINGRIETRQHPGVPDVDDYWMPRFALFRNTPLERAYANDNPDYPLNIGHNTTQWSILNYEISGRYKEDWRVIQTDFNAEYQFPIKGLSAKAVYSYYFANKYLQNQEYTYDVYDYNETTGEYYVSGGSSNPWYERGYTNVIDQQMQGHLNYINTFDDKHNVSGTYVYERYQRVYRNHWMHSVPKANALSLLYFDDMDNNFSDSEYEEARVAHIGRFSYDYDNTYFLSLYGRYDGSWKFMPGKRWGFFPGISAGWRLTGEEFVKTMISDEVLTDLKLRASYGILGNDNVAGLGSFDYIPGYDYGVGTVILGGGSVNTSRDRGAPITSLSWYESRMSNVGADFSLLQGKLSGTLEYFNRLRSGLPASREDVIMPKELGYDLARENLEKDQTSGFETLLTYKDNFGEVKFDFSANYSYARSKVVDRYKAEFTNSLNEYRWAEEGRYYNVMWGYQVDGQFQSFDEIRSYDVDIDGKGNTTLLPGDLKYVDVNGDKKIDGYDERPIGYGAAGGILPIINYGFNVNMEYKDFYAYADFSGASGYTFLANWELRWPYQNGGNLLSTMYDSRWHREDPYDPNSAWISGDNPALRFNQASHSNYNKTSTWWTHNVTYLRIRTLEVGYNLPNSLCENLKINNLRMYVSGYNLFSLDNMKQFNMDPELQDQNGLAYPQHRTYMIGFKLSL